MRHARQLERGSKVKAPIFFGVLILTMVISLILPLRPTKSVVEKRDLKTFPSFSVETLLSGSFFHDIDSWFSDTFPGRDLLFQVNSFVRSLFGFKTVEIIGTPGAVADDIPDAPFSRSE